ncbi:protease pro-enzyme activation domain-containing protein [Granulicella mallensis]|uniref:Peptidase S53 propeptide n=1 Tax=Granulicella mallensis (strain ATCC BAA-1857 / DSM 23137 / MP5ACTX8) TaxID=682795 RepID=G8P0D9_GRAMM|nr:protease pro-enzyme activation domain-containing protein [Granulicella mallensis]AEU38027.1 Peptidase S53 propeptide [Granulicella mallensis MP5ACTX8]
MSRIARYLLCAFALIASTLSVAAQRPQADRVAAQPDLRVTTRLKGHVPTWALSSNDAGAVPNDTNLRLVFVLSRSPERQAAFAQLLVDQQNPGSPNYHSWRTPQQIGSLYGPTQHDLDTLMSWLASEGFAGAEISSSHVFVSVEAPVHTVANALDTTFHYFNTPAIGGAPAAKPRVAATSDPAIPTSLAAIVSSIAGLADAADEPMSHVSPDSVPFSRAASNPVPLYNDSNGAHSLSPSDFRTIYDINPVLQSGIDGTGQKIAIVGRSQVLASDISIFESQTGLPNKAPNVIIPPSGVNPGMTKDQAEATLDVTRAIGTAPGTQVDLVITAADAGDIFLDAQYEVETLRDPIMNISFGNCETSEGAVGVDRWDTLFAQAAGEGISVFVSSGDSGAQACGTSQKRSINYICASSYATCVGGTEFADFATPSAFWSTTTDSAKGSVLSYIPEGAWNEPTVTSGGTTSFQAEGTGGGVSAIIAKPDWQTGIGIPADGFRDVPDVSFSSSRHDGYLICLASAGTTCTTFSHSWGTSAAAPGMAGITALMNQKLGTSQGNLNPLLYRLAASSNSPFHDATPATSGVACDIDTPSMCNNSTPGPTSLAGGVAGFALTTGYDQATGLGSLDVGDFLRAAVSVVSLSVSAASSSLTLTAGASTGRTDAITVSSAFYNGNATIGCNVRYNGPGTPTFIPTCALNPPTVALSSNGSATSTLTISTTARQTASAAMVATAHPSQPSLPAYGRRNVASLALGSVFLLGLLPIRRMRSFRSWRVLPSGLLLCVALGTLTACGLGRIVTDPNPPTASPSSIALSAASNSLSAGATDTFTAVVTDGGSNKANIPTGTVNFYTAGVPAPIGSASLVAGKATSSAIAFPIAGTYTITAIYQGDDNFSASTSQNLPLTVTPNGTTVGSYTVTITATGAAGLTASTAVSLTVQ